MDHPCSEVTGRPPAIAVRGWQVWGLRLLRDSAIGCIEVSWPQLDLEEILVHSAVKIQAGADADNSRFVQRALQHSVLTFSTLSSGCVVQSTRERRAPNSSDRVTRCWLRRPGNARARDGQGDHSGRGWTGGQT